ncbi:MAG: hypothetical protein OXF68_13300 [Gammaproteobacteria bacterium]|nr:hypothetical protein [Gammaproteobacteria bacterium]
MAQQTKSIWLSYDLGVQGDYEGLYAWLDDHQAKECGSSVAFFKYDFQGDLTESLMSDIGGAVSLDKRSRFYVIFKEKDRMKGAYLKGRRKTAPWEGHGANGESAEDLGEP